MRSKITSRVTVGHVLIAPMMYTHANRWSLSRTFLVGDLGDTRARTKLHPESIRRPPPPPPPSTIIFFSMNSKRPSVTSYLPFVPERLEGVIGEIITRDVRTEFLRGAGRRRENRRSKSNPARSDLDVVVVVVVVLVIAVRRRGIGDASSL
ncbi:hypothetical protein Trydic_g15696 [Trypoxylus dichotomus]